MKSNQDTVSQTNLDLAELKRQNKQTRMNWLDS